MHAYQNVEACTLFNVQITVVGEDGTLGEPTSRNIQTLTPLGKFENLVKVIISY